MLPVKVTTLSLLSASKTICAKLPFRSNVIHHLLRLSFTVLIVATGQVPCGGYLLPSPLSTLTNLIVCHTEPSPASSALSNACLSRLHLSLFFCAAKIGRGREEKQILYYRKKYRRINKIITVLAEKRPRASQR